DIALRRRPQVDREAHGREREIPGHIVHALLLRAVVHGARADEVAVRQAVLHTEPGPRRIQQISVVTGDAEVALDVVEPDLGADVERDLVLETTRALRRDRDDARSGARAEQGRCRSALDDLDALDVRRVQVRDPAADHDAVHYVERLLPTILAIDGRGPRKITRRATAGAPTVAGMFGPAPLAWI